MTIADIIKAGKGSAGSGRSWTVYSNGRTRELWHYRTLMLKWETTRDGSAHVIDYSTGHGSVSDQGGMNTAFRALGLPYRYDRDARGGGPRISELTLHPCGHMTDPRVDHRSCPTFLDMSMSGLIRASEWDRAKGVAA